MRIQVEIPLLTPVLGEYLPTLEKLIEFGCCTREGDAGLETAKSFLSWGGHFRPTVDATGRIQRAGTGTIGMVATIGGTRDRIDPASLTHKPVMTNRTTLDKETVSLENEINHYRWHAYRALVADGELPPGVSLHEANDQILSALRYVFGIGVRHNMGWGRFNNSDVIVREVALSASSPLPSAIVGEKAQANIDEAVWFYSKNHEVTLKNGNLLDSRPFLGTWAYVNGSTLLTNHNITARTDAWKRGWRFDDRYWMLKLGDLISTDMTDGVFVMTSSKRRLQTKAGREVRPCTSDRIFVCKPVTLPQSVSISELRTMLGWGFDLFKARRDVAASLLLEERKAHQRTNLNDLLTEAKMTRDEALALPRGEELVWSLAHRILKETT